MKITRDDLSRAAEGLISHQQVEKLWEALGRITGGAQRFDAAHVAYYFGGLIVIGAMGWFVSTAWESFGGVGLFLIALAYAVCFVLAGRTLEQQGLRVPSGLLYTMAVCMTPLAVYGLERATGIWPQGDPGVYRGYYEWVKGGWFLMEVATIVAGLVALRVSRFPFLTAPIAFSLWFMSMDLTPLIFGQGYLRDDRQWVSLWFGLAVLLAAYLVDLRNRTAEDFAFWGYTFGLLAFWGGLSLMEGGSEWSKFLYCLINLGLVAVSVVLRQRVFVVFGSLGVMGYLGHLSYRVFQDSLLFPFVLSLIGIFVIYAGVVYQKKSKVLEAFVQARLPETVRQLIPPRARASY